MFPPVVAGRTRAGDGKAAAKQAALTIFLFITLKRSRQTTEEALPNPLQISPTASGLPTPLQMPPRASIVRSEIIWLYHYGYFMLMQIISLTTYTENHFCKISRV